MLKGFTATQPAWRRSGVLDLAGGASLNHHAAEHKNGGEVSWPL